MIHIVKRDAQFLVLFSAACLPLLTVVLHIIRSYDVILIIGIIMLHFYLYDSFS